MEQSLQALSANQRLAEWTDRISSCRNSGISIKQWCRENGIVEKHIIIGSAECLRH
uniref:IS66 family insertion sequence element accessory protein TnpA n=1 Tax=Dehalobacter restrictus TaxID=55583 RepID=UPI003EBE7144